MNLALLDWVVLAWYFAAVVAVGLWFGRKERDTSDYFLGGRKQHWLIVGLSIVATEVSALTFLHVPADAFRGDWTYLQMYAGAFLGRLVIAFLLLPAFYGGAVTTVYEYLGQRFGPWTWTTASLLFVLSRVIGSGIRLLAASLAIAVVFDWPLEWVILGAAAVAVAYTTFGGIKAIIWTDALQAVIFLAGGAAAILFLTLSLPGGLADNLREAWTAGKTNVFTWTGSINSERVFWVLLISATFQNCAALGVDQDLTQRMLTCPDLRRAQRGVLFNAFIGLPIVCLFLFVGTMLWLYYHADAARAVPDAVFERNDLAFSYFIAHVLPSGVGLKGLLVAGIFAAAMSSLDSALGALSSTAVTDFYRPLLRRRSRRSTGRSVHARRAVSFSPRDVAAHGAEPDDADERHYLRVARAFTFAFGIVLAGVALAFVGYDDLLWEVFQWAGLVFGGMLGVFLLGVTTRHRGHDRINVAAMLMSVAGLAALKLYQDRSGVIYLAWPWWVVLGTVWTYVLSMCFARRRTA